MDAKRLASVVAFLQEEKTELASSVEAFRLENDRLLQDHGKLVSDRDTAARELQVSADVGVKLAGIRSLFDRVPFRKASPLVAAGCPPLHVPATRPRNSHATLSSSLAPSPHRHSRRGMQLWLRCGLMRPASCGPKWQP